MAANRRLFTRFTIFLWCGIGFLIVSLRHILFYGYNHRAGFMLLLSLALLAAAFTDRQKRRLQARREEQQRQKDGGNCEEKIVRSSPACQQAGSAELEIYYLRKKFWAKKTGIFY